MRFIDEVTYTLEDTSVVYDYRKGFSGILYHPNALFIDLPECDADSLTVTCYVSDTESDSITFKVPNTSGQAELYNFIPQRVYNYEVSFGKKVLQRGTITTDGRVRMIRVDGKTHSVRDLGGWVTEDGKKRIKYGKLFRGSELNWEYSATPEGIDMLRQLGIGAEIDMRASWEANNRSETYPNTEGVSVFGFQNSANTPFGEVPTYYYSNSSGQLPSHLNSFSWQYKWRQEFNFIVNNLRRDRAVYFHCIYGRDRTGYLALLMEGLLGLSYSDLIKEFELSLLGLKYLIEKPELDEAITFINQFSGNTLAEKFYTYFTTKIRASKEDIDYFRSVMLEDVYKPIITTNVEDAMLDVTTRQQNVYDLMGRRVNRPAKGGLYLMPDGRGKYRQIYIK